MRIATEQEGIGQQRFADTTRPRRLTLHPSFPLVRLISIQEPEIALRLLHGQKTDRQAKQAEERERIWVELFLLLEPET